jgi:hypothetical protein
VESLDTAESLRHFAHDLVVDGEHDRLAGRFQAQHGGGQQVACGCLHRILDQGAVPSAVIGPAAPGIVLVTKLAGELELPGTKQASGYASRRPLGSVMNNVLFSMVKENRLPRLIGAPV